MVKINLVVRELGKLKPDYSLDFELPAVPAIGSYISIQRPDHPDPYAEDVIVRKIWWRLKHSETAAASSNPPKVGTVNEIFVECDVAIGPYSSDNWLKWANAGKARGADIEEFDVARCARASLRDDPFDLGGPATARAPRNADDDVAACGRGPGVA